MKRLSLLSIRMLSLLALFLLPAMSVEARTVSLLVHSPKGKPAELRTSAQLQWLMQELSRKSIREQGLHLFNYGHFSSPSRTASSKTWDKRARNAAQQAASLYSSQSSDTTGALFRAHNFFKFGQVYFLDRDAYRKNYFLLGLTMFRDNNIGQAKKFIYSGHLLEPTKDSLNDLSGKENKVLKAMRCHLTKERPATLKLLSNSKDALIQLNGYSVGFGEVTLSNLRPGEYLIRMERAGYRPWGKRVYVGSGQSRTVRAYIGRSPRARLYNSLCTRLLDSKDPEKLKDTLNFFAQRLVDSKSEKTEKMFAGCFKGSGNGKQGTLSWYIYDKKAAKPIRQGRISIPASTTGRMKKLSSLLKTMSLQTQSFDIKKRLVFPAIPAGASCPPLNSIKLAPPKPRVRIPTAPVSPWKSRVELGEQFAFTLNYGFVVQGKVLGYKAKKLKLQVVSKFSKPFLLRKMTLDFKEVKTIKKLGNKTSNGYHINERLVLMTVYGLMLEGVLISDDGIRLTLQTSRGRETLRWSEVKKVVRRDR